MGGFPISTNANDSPIQYAGHVQLGSSPVTSLMTYLCIPTRVGVRDAVLEIWQANNQGNYDPADTPMYQQINYDYTNVNANPNGYNCRARVRSDQDGKFSFDTSESFTILISVTDP